MSDISSRVKASLSLIIVDKLGVDENEVVSEANFTNDLGADSLDTVELIAEFKKEFDIQIPDDQAENIATVGQAIQFTDTQGRIFRATAKTCRRYRITEPLFIETPSWILGGLLSGTSGAAPV